MVSVLLEEISLDDFSGAFLFVALWWNSEISFCFQNYVFKKRHNIFFDTFYESWIYFLGKSTVPVLSFFAFLKNSILNEKRTRLEKCWMSLPLLTFSDLKIFAHRIVHAFMCSRVVFMDVMHSDMSKLTGYRSSLDCGMPAKSLSLAAIKRFTPECRCLQIKPLASASGRAAFCCNTDSAAELGCCRLWHFYL